MMPPIVPWALALNSNPSTKATYEVLSGDMSYGDW
jgi:hypothetical protein